MVINGRILQIFRDGRRSAHRQRLQLPAGAQGNMQTLGQMARIVREDSAQKDVRNWIRRDIVGIENKTLDDVIKAAFYFCRDKIIFEPEKSGFETIADLWSALYILNDENGSGDCAIKVTALATILGSYNLRPVFTAIRQVPNVEWFNHVYITLVVNKKELALDPTPKEFRVGDQAESLQKVKFAIF